jgi:hypothetical protein
VAAGAGGTEGQIPFVALFAKQAHLGFHYQLELMNQLWRIVGASGRLCQPVQKKYFHKQEFNFYHSFCSRF